MQKARQKTIDYNSLVRKMPLTIGVLAFIFSSYSVTAYAQDRVERVEEPGFAENIKADRLLRGELDETRPIARENLPQKPAQGYGGRVEKEPYTAIGIRSGSFILRPSLEQGLRATSNANNSNNGKSAVLSETQLRLDLETDFLRHGAYLNLAGNWSKSISGDNVSEPFVLMNSGLRLDLDTQSRLNFGIDYLLRRESASSPNSVAQAVENPIVHTITGKIGAEREAGLLFARAEAKVDRNIYGEASLVNGGYLSQSDRNNNYYGAKLRGGFQLSAALKPFLEIEAGKRHYDEKYDHNGFQRSGDQYAVNAGLIFDMGEKFNGELSAGYVNLRLDDYRLQSIGGLGVNAAINWSPRRGTDVALKAQTYIDSSTTANDSGSILYLASLELKRSLRSDLMVLGGLDLRIRDNKDNTGFDYTYGAQLGATYWFNRYVALNARLRHEQLRSSIADREYRSNSIYVGLKLQR